MQVSLLPHTVPPADLTAEQLAGNPRLSEPEKIAELSRQFEAVLLRQILGHAQKPLFRSALTPDSNITGIYRDLATQQLADNISRAGVFGVAGSLKAQLLRQLAPEAAKAGGAPAAASTRAAP